VIQQGRCPSCGRAQTVYVGAVVNLCLKCRFHWSLPDALSPELAANATLTDFSQAELQRLDVFRRAVAAGYYSDWS
jgi:ribosomal protein L37AE/L43A